MTPELVAQSQRAGGASAWFEHQLHPGRIRDDAAARVTNWFPSVRRAPGELARTAERGGQEGWEVSADLARWTLMRRLLSQRQLHETMTDFWSNLLHVPAPERKSWPWRARYDQVVRAHALGRFDDLLVACVLHPAMGCYLDNARSTAAKPNENLGRELLELHTVGVDLDYSEQEVRDSALILTGWLVDVFGSYHAAYSPLDHWVGRVRVLDFGDANSGRDGRALARRYVRYLAHHPATARRVAHRLAVRFVADEPPASLVTDLAKVFTVSGTDIKATLRALVQHPAFGDSVGAKVRTPAEDAVATWRVLGVQPRPPARRDSFARAALGQTTAMGQRPFDWGRPDGFPDVARAWTGVSRVLNSFDVHKNIAGGFYPTHDVGYRPPTSWLPRLPARLGEVVDAVAVQVLARPATKTLKEAVSARLELPLGYRVRHEDDLPDWRMVPLLATVLDSPAHMTR